jgi:hypothetical protein
MPTKDRTEIRDRSSLRLERGKLLLKLLWFPHVVTVEKRDEWRVGCFESRLTCGLRAAHMASSNDFDARIVPDVSADSLETAVVARVVHDQ